MLRTPCKYTSLGIDSEESASDGKELSCTEKSRKSCKRKKINKTKKLTTRLYTNHENIETNLRSSI